MSLRKTLILSILVVLYLIRPVASQVNGIEVSAGATAQVFGGKSPVVKVKDADGKELASISIEKDPGQYIYSKSANTLYVVHNEKQLEHFISAVNLTTQRVDKQITVGAGAEVHLLVSSGGTRLFCYTGGKLSKENREKWLEPPYDPTVSVIDTTSNQIIATHKWLDSFRAKVQSEKWFFFTQFL